MRITLAAPWTDADGNTHEADASVEVSRRVGKHLVWLGLARAAVPAPKAAQPAPKASAPATGDSKITGKGE